MQPQENLQSNERIPEPTAEAEYVVDINKPHNGVYTEAEALEAEAIYKIEQPAENEFKAAETAYKVEPPVKLNTVTFAEDNTAYQVATMENVAAMDDTIDVSAETVPDSEASTELAEVTPEATTVDTEAAPLESEAAEEDIIDVETREVSGENAGEEVVDLEQAPAEAFIDLEDPDDVTDIETLFDSTDKIKTAEGEMALTPKIKALSKNVFGFMNSMFSDPKTDIPETVDWGTFIATEEYDPGEVYDYPALIKFYNAQYKRKRAKYGAGKLLERMTASIPSVEGPAAVNEGGAPPEQPPDGNTEATPQNPEASSGAEGEILKIEMDQPEGGAETPQLEYEGAAPALTYEPGATEANQGQAGQKQITQQ